MCDSCSAVYVKYGKSQGIVHENGCPDSWKTEFRSCIWCDADFLPTSRYQDFCCDDCNEAYNT